MPATAGSPARPTNLKAKFSRYIPLRRRARTGLEKYSTTINKRRLFCNARSSFRVEIPPRPERRCREQNVNDKFTVTNVEQRPKYEGQAPGLTQRACLGVVISRRLLVTLRHFLI